MISNPAIAKHVKELMMDVFVRVDQSITMVRQTCAKEEADAYSRAAGRIAGNGQRPGRIKNEFEML